MVASLNTPEDMGEAAATPVPAADPVNILLVDDQPGRLLSYRAVLEPLGEHLVEATSGVDALRLLMEGEFALILLDLHMPEMDGYETARLIRGHPRTRDIPIVFVTAVFRDEARDPERTIPREIRVPGSRADVRARTVTVALHMLREALGG